MCAHVYGVALGLWLVGRPWHTWSNIVYL